MVCIALKIIEIVATWCDIFKTKRQQIRFRLGLHPQGRINHGAKRAMAQGPRRKGAPAPPINFLGYLIVIYIGNCLTSLFFELTTSYIEK